MSALEKAIPVTLRQIEAMARGAWNGAKGDIKKAAKTIADEVGNDPSMLLALAMSYLQHLGFEHLERKHSREAIVRAVTAQQDTSHRVVALAQDNAHMMLNFALFGGKRLRDADKQDLRLSAERYYAHGSDMVHKGRWLALVASKVPDGKRVGEALTEEAVRKLFEEARHAKK